MRKSDELAPQQMIKIWGRTGILLLACSAAAISLASGGFGTQAAMSEKPAAVQKKPDEPLYKVVSPVGEPTIKMITMVPRLNSLAGKTVCMVGNQFKASITHPIIGEALKKKYPDIKIVLNTESSAGGRAEPGRTPQTEFTALQAAFKEKGCNAVVSGNGG